MKINPRNLPGTCKEKGFPVIILNSFERRGHFRKGANGLIFLSSITAYFGIFEDPEG
jgi:hypothetical protein